MLKKDYKTQLANESGINETLEKEEEIKPLEEQK